MKTTEAGPQFGITFGALAPPLSEQLAEQGFTARKASIKRWQDFADYITRLSIAGFLSEVETHRARSRLIKRMGHETEKIDL
jgi:hypothetical protein